MISRGDICWVALRRPRGSEPGHPRPAVVIQADSFNRSRIRTVIVAIITSNLDRARSPGTVRLGARASGLGKPSVVNASQLATVDRSQVSAPIASLSGRTMDAVDAALRSVLGLV